MRSNNTFGVQFITRSNKSKDGLHPIYARISVNGRRVEVSLKRFIHPDNWNDTKGSAKGKSDEIRSLNTYLEQVRS
ncbi:MAG: Arm DNA-binding domain-containing protein [Bacteroidales bacterium]